MTQGIRSSTQGIRSSRLALRPLVRALAACSLITLWPGLPTARAQSLPSGLKTTSGQASVSTSGKSMTVTNSANAILNWQSFSIGAGNSVRFQQPSAASKVLNRVTGNDPSNILGSLTSNGSVWLLNPNGVLFGRDARVDVGGLVATTLGLGDNQWLAGQFALNASAGSKSASVSNLGELRSALGGRIALLGDDVSNEGLIEAPGGQVLLAAGKSIDLVDTGTPNLAVRVNAPSGTALNLGTLVADGGRVDIQGAMVNQEGIVRANALERGAGGEIVMTATQSLTLAAGSTTQAEGTTTGGHVALDAGGSGTALVSGSVSVASAGGTGGQITALGQHVGLLDGSRLDASGTTGGGEVLVGGGASGKDARYRDAEAVYVGPDAQVSADALTRGNGGHIVLWSDEATRAYGRFTARGGPGGGDGGLIETSGGWLDARPTFISATAAKGKAGEWLLDPHDIAIVDGDGLVGFDNQLGPDFTSSSDSAQIGTGQIVSALNSNNSVTITTGGGGKQSGDITMTGSDNKLVLSAAPTLPVSLTLNASRNIALTNAAINNDTTTAGATLDVTLNAAGSGQGAITLTNSAISTAGGKINLGGSAQAVGSDGKVSPFVGAVGYGSNLDASVQPTGVTISGSTLNAGSGSIAISGSSIASVVEAGGVDIDQSALTASNITVKGWVDSAVATWGVVVDASQMSATSSMSLGGTLFAGQFTSANQTTVGGVVISDSQLTGGNVSVTGAMTIDNIATDHRQPIGVLIDSDGTLITVGKGGSLAIDGTVTATDYVGGTSSVDISYAIPSQDLVIDASAGSSLTINGHGPAQVYVASNIAGPDSSNGTFLLGSESQLELSGASLKGGSEIQLQGQGIGLASSDVTSQFAGTGIVLSGADNTGIASFFSDGGTLSTPNGRWLIYAASPDPESFAPSDLPYDFRQYNANPTTPIAGSGNGFMFAALETYGFAGTPTKTYDGTTTIQLTPNNVAVTGKLVPGDTATVGSSAEGQFFNPDNPNDPTAKNAGINKYISVPDNFVTFTDAAGKPVYGYFAEPLLGTIDQKALTATGATVADKTYNGNAGASVTAVSFDGLVGSEQLTSSAVGTFQSKNVSRDANGNVLPQPVAVGSITLGDGTNGGLASNYVLAVNTTTASATIKPKSLTVDSATAADKVYDGNQNAAIDLSISGVIDPEDLTASAVGMFQSKNVNRDPKTGAVLAQPVTVTLTIHDGEGPNAGLASNYQFDTNPITTSATITPKSITVSGATAADKTYDGNANATVTGVSFGGLIGSEQLAASAIGTFQSKNVNRDLDGVAQAQPVSITGVTLGNGANGGLASNYQLGAGTTATTTATILPKDISLISATAADKAYDGTTNATVTGVSFDGLVGSEQLVAASSGAFLSKDVSRDPNTGAVQAQPVSVVIGTVSDGANGGLASNYQLAINTATTSATITPKSITVAGATAADKIYDARTNATVTGVSFDGLVGAEQLTASASGAFQSKNVSRDLEGAVQPQAVSVTGITIGDGANGGLASNYQLDNNTTATTATITPKGITVIGATAADKVYDAKTDATVTGVSFDGLVDAEQLTASASGAFQSKNVNRNPNSGAVQAQQVSVSGITVANGANGGLASNYQLDNDTATTTATITPKSITATATAADKAYDGNANATVTAVSVDGLVGSEQLTGSAAAGTFQSKNVSRDPNTGVALAQPVSVTGITIGDGADGGLASNYQLVNLTTETSATITPKGITVAGATAANKTYDGKTDASVIGVSFDGLVGQEQLTASATGTFQSKNVSLDPNTGAVRPQPVSVGGITIANGADGGLASNYQLDNNTAATTATITPKGLTVSALTAAGKVYDGSTAATATGWSLAGIVSGDSVSVGAGTAAFVDPNAGKNKPVDGTATALAGTDAHNYVIASGSSTGTADISQATLTYVANDATAVVGGTLPLFTGHVDGFVAGETLGSATTGTAAWLSNAAGATQAGSYAVNGSGLSARNYAFVQDPGNATALTLTPIASTVGRSTSDVTSSLNGTTTTLASPISTAPAGGNVLDVVTAMAGGATQQGASFSSVPLGEMTQQAVAALLASRDAYKDQLFAAAVTQLQQNPALADTPACTDIRQAATGECLVTETLKADARAQYFARIAEQQPVAAGPLAAASTLGSATAPGTASADVAAATRQLTADLLGPYHVKHAALPQIERKVAVLIGVDHFDDARIPKLDNAVNDAETMAQLFRSELGYETKVLKNATKKDVVATLNELIGEVGPKDSVIVYYAGHGDLVPATGLGYWQLSDADADKPETWLSNSDIGKLMAEFGATQVALISDSCYSGALVSDRRIQASAQNVDAGTLLSRKAVVVMSSGGNEPVFDSSAGGHSPFASSLMAALKKVPDWQAGGNVFERVQQAVSKQLPQHPQYGASIAAGHQEGADYLFEQRQLETAP